LTTATLSSLARDAIFDVMTSDLMFSKFFWMFDVFATNLMLKTNLILYATVFYFLPFFRDGLQVYQPSLTFKSLKLSFDYVS